MQTLLHVLPFVLWLGVAVVIWPRCAEALIEAVCGDGLGADSADMAIGYTLGAMVAVAWPVWTLPRIAHRSHMLETRSARQRRRLARIRELERELGLAPLDPSPQETVAELWRRHVSASASKYEHSASRRLDVLEREAPHLIDRGGEA